VLERAFRCFRVGAADDPDVVRSAFEADQETAWRAAVNGREHPLTISREGADLKAPRQSPADELETGIGWLVGFFEHLDRRHCGQRCPQVAMYRGEFFDGGQVQDEFVAVDE
jgi:hypothetical protein